MSARAKRFHGDLKAAKPKTPQAVLQAIEVQRGPKFRSLDLAWQNRQKHISPKPRSR